MGARQFVHLRTRQKLFERKYNSEAAQNLWTSQPVAAETVENSGLGGPPVSALQSPLQLGPEAQLVGLTGRGLA